MQDAMAFVRPHSFYLLHFQPVDASQFLINDNMLQNGMDSTFVPSRFLYKSKKYLPLLGQEQ